MSSTRWLVLSCALAAVACKEQPESERAAPTPAGESGPLSPDAERAALERVPVSADFEAQAATEITPRNIDSELDKLEKEITE